MRMDENKIWEWLSEIREFWFQDIMIQQGRGDVDCVFNRLIKSLTSLGLWLLKEPDKALTLAEDIWLWCTLQSRSPQLLSKEGSTQIRSVQLSIAQQVALNLKIETQIYFSKQKGYQLQCSHVKSLWFNQMRKHWYVILACHTDSCLHAISSSG